MAVCDAVEGYLRTYPNQSDVCNPKHFDLMVAHVQEAYPALARVDPLALRAKIAMCWLGPRSVGPPPSALRRDLLDIIRRCERSADKRPGRVMEFAIAYGCGNWRTTAPGHGGWGRRWPNAVSGLARALRKPVKEASHWLAFHLLGAPPIGPAARRNVADGIAIALCAPEKRVRVRAEGVHILHTPGATRISIDGQPSCDVGAGAKFVFGSPELEVSRGTRGGGPAAPATSAPTQVVVSARDDDTRVEIRERGLKSRRIDLNNWDVATVKVPGEVAIRECTCGREACTAEHRLERWDPATSVVSLWSYVASAAKGRSRRLLPGSFAQGMYYARLTRGSMPRARLVPVEFKVCECGQHYDGRDGHTHDGVPVPFNAKTMRKIAHAVLIVADAQPPRYERDIRLLCKNRAAHYNKKLTGGPPPTGLKEAWDNYYDVPAAVGDLPLIEEVLRDPRRLESVASTKRVSVNDVRQRLEAEVESLKQLLRAHGCPLCSSTPGRRGRLNHVWVRI